MAKLNLETCMDIFDWFDDNSFEYFYFLLKLSIRQLFQRYSLLSQSVSCLIRSANSFSRANMLPSLVLLKSMFR